MSACPRRSLSEAGSRCMLTTNGQTRVRYKKKWGKKTKRQKEKERETVIRIIYIYLPRADTTVLSFRSLIRRERENHLGDRRRRNECFTLRDFVLCRLSLPHFRLLFRVLQLCTSREGWRWKLDSIRFQISRNVDWLSSSSSLKIGRDWSGKLKMDSTIFRESVMNIPS